MSFWDKEELVGEVEKNGGNVYKIKNVVKGGRQFVDLREFFTGKDGKELPTKKGVAIPYELVDDVIANLEMAKLDQR